MKKIVLFTFLLMSIGSFSQEKLTLEECYNLVKTNYPLAKQNDLLAKQNAIDLEVIATERLPQLDFSAQATYQSDVIEVPIPNATITPLNKDQYRATLSANQFIFGDGLIDASLSAKKASLKTKQKQVDVHLYQLKKQINQLYFSVLLLQENSALLNAKNEQLKAKLNEVKSGVKNGIILPSSLFVLEAELLKIKQQFTVLELNKSSLLQTLSSIIGKNIDTNLTLTNPEITTDLQASIIRPELDLFQLKKEEITVSERLISKKTAPKLFGFANAGYGNPGLNMLDNSFQPFYVVGVKLNWNPFDWNANKKQRESLLINKDIIDNEAAIFNLNTNIELQQQQIEINKIEQFITSDIEIIELRKKVLKSTESQLKNGVISTSEYITELTNLYEDENTLSTHKIKLLLARANYKTIKGQ
ncbi:transporter [Polaribacter sp. SA4-10]|uniref:TolC family protein n=1 Tax=Polaribacter sp. SA4-10 TaxID=754397 RepID=UPI000B3D3815|nr:TolC family protein [Polaribacter sp. SA4-10]ARV05781.1 transporter [Polaribacter sp. SA4-10]